jgi:UDP:flavonoid glycosyltransferase YjiC (YdhE family)
MIVTPFKEHLPAALPHGCSQFDFVPFSRVFPRCAAVVHHGGIGTCAQGLAAGKPQLLMPMAHDQPDNGWRLRALRVGDYLYPGKFTAQLVTERLRLLTSSKDVAFACERVREMMQHQMPPETMAVMLEQFAQKSCRPQVRACS